MNNIYISIMLFIGIMCILYTMKPALIFDQNGGYRQFGIGYSNKTILPIWLATIFISILSYLGIQFVSVCNDYRH